MKKLFIAILILAFSHPAFAANITEVTADNGVKGWLAEDHSLPIIVFSVTFKNAGAAYDPEKKQGLSTMAASMLDEGAGDFDSLAFHKELENNAIRFGAESDYDNFHITIKTLSKNRDKALSLLRLALEKPRYDEDAILRMKNEITAIIKKREEEPTYLAEEKFHEVFFGKHPYAHKIYGDEKSIAGIDKADLSSFGAKNFTRNRLIINASGDLSAAEFKEILQKYFSLKPGEAIAEIPEFTGYPAKPITEKIKMALPQSHAAFGMKGIKRDDADYYKAYILNYIVGGGEFESRLMKEVREKRGLAYSVSTYLEPYAHAGIFAGSISTRKEKISQSLNIVHDELKKIAKDGVTAAEVDAAKKHLLMSLVLSLDSNQSMASFMDIMQVYNLGIDYLDKRNQYLGAVTVKDVNIVARKILSGAATTVTVGE